jgi:hypothetical protein
MTGKESNGRVCYTRICVAGKLVFKLESTTTLYSGIFLAAVSVATVLTLRERFGRLWLRESSLEGFILETNLSSAFTALILFQFVHVAEIWKRIEFINSWGIFLVNMFINVLRHETRERSLTTTFADISFEHVTNSKCRNGNKKVYPSKRQVSHSEQGNMSCLFVTPCADKDPTLGRSPIRGIATNV